MSYSRLPENFTFALYVFNNDSCFWKKPYFGLKICSTEKPPPTKFKCLLQHNS